MTRDETKGFLAMMSVLYPSFKVEDKSLMTDMWSVLASDESKHSLRNMQTALQIFAQSDPSQFAPSFGKLNSIIENQIFKSQKQSEQEALQCVLDAKRNIIPVELWSPTGFYKSREAEESNRKVYESLNDNIKKAIGGYWMFLNFPNEPNSFQVNDFFKHYQEVVSVENTNSMLTRTTQRTIEQIRAENAEIIDRPSENHNERDLIEAIPFIEERISNYDDEYLREIEEEFND